MLLYPGYKAVRMYRRANFFYRHKMYFLARAISQRAVRKTGTHLSGTGIGDMFDITVMPVTGEPTYARGNIEDPQSGLWSMADRTQEIAEAGYYAVPLTRYGILAELTATPRVGIHRIQKQSQCRWQW